MSSELSLEELSKLADAGAPDETEMTVADQRKVAIHTLKKSYLATYAKKLQHTPKLIRNSKAEGYLDGLNDAFDIIFEQLIQGPIELNVTAVETQKPEVKTMNLDALGEVGDANENPQETIAP